MSFGFTIPQLWVLLEADVDYRRAEREVGGGDYSGEVRALRMRMRRGEVSQVNVDLAAFLGDLVARELASEQADNYRFYSFRDRGVSISSDLVGVLELADLDLGDIFSLVADVVRRVFLVFVDRFPEYRYRVGRIVRVMGSGSVSEVQRLGYEDLDFLDQIYQDLEYNADWGRREDVPLLDYYKGFDAVSVVSSAIRFFMSRELLFAADALGRAFGMLRRSSGGGWFFSRVCDYLLGRV